MIRMTLAAAALAFGTAAGPLSSANVVVASSPGADIMARIQSERPPVPATGFTAAPVPNADIDAPVAIDANATQPSIKPTILRSTPVWRGDGYVPGSVANPDQSKKLTPSPGAILSVPLQ